MIDENRSLGDIPESASIDFAPHRIAYILALADFERLAIGRRGSIRRPSNVANLPPQMRRQTELLATGWLVMARTGQAPTPREIRRLAVRFRQAIYRYVWLRRFRPAEIVTDLEDRPNKA